MVEDLHLVGEEAVNAYIGSFGAPVVDSVDTIEDEVVETLEEVVEEVVADEVLVEDLPAEDVTEIEDDLE